MHTLETRFWRLVELVLALLLGAMTTLIFANVVLRYGFASSLSAGIELSRLMMVWLIMLGAALVMRRDEHLAVVDLVSRLPRPFYRAARVGCTLFMLCASVLLLIGAWRLTDSNWNNVSQLTGIPRALGYAAGVVSAALMAIIALCKLPSRVTGGARP